MAWDQPHKFSHWLRHATLPALILAALLALPHPWNTGLLPVSSVITLQLQPPEPETIINEAKPLPPVVTEPVKPEVQPEVKPETQPLPQPAAQPPTAVTEPVVSTPAPSESNEPQAPPAITSGDILLMVKNRTSVDITPEFQARNGPARDFYIPRQEIQNWLDDIPYLDESVDRPTIEMRFYAAGLEGQIEKFFDKITIRKTFTTKYGTKIHCALIGVVAACGWK